MIRVVELFGGIGSCTRALSRLDADYEIVDYVEIDKFAVQSYNALNGTNFKPTDITHYTPNISDVDLLMHGSPCQDISTLGLQAGANKNSNTRSSLLYETVRIVKIIKPKVIIWENVANLLSAKHITNFKRYIKELENLGYTSFYDILNAIDFGIPQSRKRVFTISVLQNKKTFHFPHGVGCGKLKDYLQENVDSKYEWSDSLRDYMLNRTKFKPNIITYNSHYAGTITTSSCHGTANYLKIDDKTYRRLTPLECWRLMGFLDCEFYTCKKAGISDTQLCRQAGNSIVVHVLVAILKELVNNDFL